MKNEFKDKIILVTGGTGSIGAELVKQILLFEPKQLRVFSRDETKQYELMEELGSPANVSLLIGDIRDKERLNFAFKNVDIVFHAAAMKHVSIGEYNPFEVIKTNIVGSQNVIDAAIKQKVKKVVGISTDKAVNPVNVLGISKLMMEKLFINATYYTKKSVTSFCCVRFGNVAWSRGSVLPSWKKQAEKNGCIHVTNSEMTRFFMSKDQAIRLVLRSAELSQGGEIFIFKMPTIELGDLAKLFLEKYFPQKDVEIKTVGQRDGEKIHEGLFDPTDQYQKIFEDEEIYIFIPYMRLSKKMGFEQHEAPGYKGFKLVEEIANISSADSIDKSKIKDVI
jgi:FlaA1/EpsC-like NDP-sugar epimerase